MIKWLAKQRRFADLSGVPALTEWNQCMTPSEWSSGGEGDDVENPSAAARLHTKGTQRSGRCRLLGHPAIALRPANKVVRDLPRCLPALDLNPVPLAVLAIEKHVRTVALNSRLDLERTRLPLGV